MAMSGSWTADAGAILSRQNVTPCHRPRFWLIVLVTLLSACGGLPHLTIYERDGDRVVLQDLPSGYPELPKYDHPASLPPKGLLQLFQGVLYRQSGALPLAWQPPRTVFTERQQELLATQLANAFGQVLPEEVVAFSVHDDKDSEMYTSGFCFVADNELHLVIENLREFTYVGEHKPYQQEPRWELLPGFGQRLHPTRPPAKGVDPHWIVFPLKK